MVEESGTKAGLYERGKDVFMAEDSWLELAITSRCRSTCETALSSSLECMASQRQRTEKADSLRSRLARRALVSWHEHPYMSTTRHKAFDRNDLKA